MNRRFVKDAQRALTVLGCTEVERIKLDRDYHVAARQPNGTRIYLCELQDVTDAILKLSRGDGDR
jgi:hypothetical protein